MKNYKTGFLLLFVIVMGGYALGSSTTDKIIFLNTGKMYVGTSGHSSLVSLYIPQAYRDANNSGPDSVNIELAGYMELGGNFYHDAAFQGFRITPSGYTKAKTGVFRFSGNHGNGTRRYITTYTSDSLTCTSFNRGNYYISFPNIILDSNDSLVIPARMGIDATTFKRGTTNTGGSLVLRSDKINGYDYDASLRIIGSGSSASLVDVGSVIVEREMSLYRYGDGTTPALFPFATPFKNTQLSGYFAGNWVRRPLADGEMGSTTYLFANKDNNPVDNYIDMDQYVYVAAETLVPAQAYLIKPRPANYPYSNLQASGGLWYTGATASAYDKGKFYFNGKVYTVAPYQEQLFAEDVLSSKSASGIPSSTVNWLIGNSYTCPISTAELARIMEKAAGLTFSSTAYIYPAGSQSYQPITVSGTGSSITGIRLYRNTGHEHFLADVEKRQHAERLYFHRQRTSTSWSILAWIS